MKKITLVFALFFAAIALGQNESSGSIATTITTPSPISGETFRFGPGIVTQLDSGSGFGFTNDRWFSLGRLNTGSQNVYGLRFQIPNRSITLGYQDINDVNPRIQWIGASSFSGTDLEFRAANSFTSTSSTLVATMTNDGKTFFGQPFTSSGSSTKVGVDYTDVSSGSRTGVEVLNTSGSSGSATGFKSVNNVSCYVKTGLSISSSGGAYGDTGVSVSLRDGFYSSGVSTFVTGNGGYTYGVSGRITLPSGVTSNSFGAGIYGNSAAVTNRFAGYFDGNVTVNGMFTSSDKKLKEQIETEENVLDKIMELNAVTYKFKENDQLNLPAELQHGFIAQNIEEVFPELVTTIKKPIIDKENKLVGEYEYKAVNYTGLISILTSSIQDLNEKVTALENEKKARNTSDELGLLDEADFSMEQNIPNPFNSQATISYTLPPNVKANITIFDMTGKYIREYDLRDEKGKLVINSNDIGKGMFLYSLISGGEIIITKKMIVK
ncbi:putative secreted protein (Por secretion system target) [Kordia periserrulae]|uniref:Putative secreted protein (Por secretion system target) n=1 Tax=Kordia periserrulae TaxID=701523 RepID=A0A2T6BU55_9FLAO|nr:tail fiber domain-containing protein [Kordia periserrulae]PTX59556.1 putative secreted protein (Por secretion system target) [Kordia periserrulae]